MPLYEYKCVKCGHRFEKIESVSSPISKKCPKCGAKAERMLSAAAIQFKGSGWYVTDYAGKKTDGSSSEKSAEGEASKAKEKPGDAKPPESSNLQRARSLQRREPQKRRNNSARNRRSDLSGRNNDALPPGRLGNRAPA